MSLNIGTKGVEAIKALRTHDYWDDFVAGFVGMVQARLHSALEASPEHRVDQTAYVRALHDVYAMLEATAKNQNSRQVAKLAPKVDA